MPVASVECELRCPVCYEYFEDPVMLQCTHHLCMAHVPELAGAKGALACPTCGDTTTVPKSGLRVNRPVQKIVEDFKAAVLASRASVSKSADSKAKPGDSGSRATAAPMCGFCEEQPAVRRCIQCDGVLCEACEVSSHSKGFFKSHRVENLEPDCVEGRRLAKGGARSSTAELTAQPMMCYSHPEERLSFYCLECRELICSHCLIMGEHKGHQQTPVAQARETGGQTLAAWNAELQRRAASADALIDLFHEAGLEVDRNAEAQRAAIHSEMDRLQTLVEAKRQDLLSKSGMEEKPKRSQLEKQTEHAEAAKVEALHLAGRTQELLAVPSEHVLLACMLPLVQDMKKCVDRPLDSQPKITRAFRPVSADVQARAIEDVDLEQPKAASALSVSALQVAPPALHARQCLQSRPCLPAAVPHAVGAPSTTAYLHTAPLTTISTAAGYGVSPTKAFPTIAKPTRV